MTHWLQSVVNLVLPPTCLCCGKIVDSTGLCPTCWRQIRFIAPPFCTVCGHPFPISGDEVFTCARCLRRPPSWHRARSALCYDDATKSMILRFKHGDRLDGAALFARWMIRAGAEYLQEADAILPVPLHRWRLWRRRYNQAAELGRAIAHLSGLPFWSGVLCRDRATPPQGHLSAEERRRNVRGAFRIRSRRQKDVKGKCLILVDDVLTTGATLEECAHTLLQAGAKQVNLLTLARVTVANL